MAFLREMSCYKSAECVVAMPPSDPTKTYNFPRVLAAGIANRWGRADLTASLVTTSVRSSLKNKSKAE